MSAFDRRAAAILLAEAGMVGTAFFLPLSIVGEQIFGALLAVGVIAAWLLGARSLVPRSLLVPVLSFVAVGALSTLVSPVDGTYRSWVADRPVFLLVLVPAVFALSRDPERLMRRVLLAVLATGTFVAILGIAQRPDGFDLNHLLGVRKIPLRIDSPDGHGFAAIGTFNSRLTFAAVESGVIVLAAALGVSRLSLQVRVAAALATLLIAFGLGASFARASWIGVFLGMAVLLPMLGRRAPALILGIAVAVGGVSVLVPSVRARALSSLEKSSNTDRLFIWSRATEVIADYPVQGVGVYAFPTVAAPYYDRFDPLFPMHTWAHDMPLTLLAETGVAGLLTWIWMFVAMAGVALSALRQDESPLLRAARLGALGAAAAMFAITFFHDVLYDGEAAMALFTFAGLATVRAPPDDDPETTGASPEALH